MLIPRTARAALAVSVPWALLVWWLGEGMGGMLTGAASPLTGAPGAVLIYALLAGLLWPSAARAPGRVIAYGGAGGRAGAEAAWLALWGMLAVLCAVPANRVPDGISGALLTMRDGEPGWIAALDGAAARAFADDGAAVSACLAGLLAVIAVAVLLPPLTRPALVAAIAVALALWIVPESFGGLFTGQGTDPNTGPLLALLALAYWPRRVPMTTVAPSSGELASCGVSPLRAKASAAAGAWRSLVSASRQLPGASHCGASALTRRSTSSPSGPPSSATRGSCTRASAGSMPTASVGT
jgi:hypothetical protein